jgi:hypothetical protein
MGPVKATERHLKKGKVRVRVGSRVLRSIYFSRRLPGSVYLDAIPMSVR